MRRVVTVTLMILWKVRAYFSQQMRGLWHTRSSVWCANQLHLRQIFQWWQPGGCRCWTWFIVANAWQRVSSLKAMLINISTSKPLLRAAMAGFPQHILSVYRCIPVCVCAFVFNCHDVLITDSPLSCRATTEIFLFWLKLISYSIKLCKQDLIGALMLQYNRWRADLRTNRAATEYYTRACRICNEIHTRYFQKSHISTFFFSNKSERTTWVMKENDGTRGMDKDRHNYSVSRWNVHGAVSHPNMSGMSLRQVV